MKIELENKDLDILAEKVAKQIEERLSNQAVHDKLNEKLKQSVDFHADYYLSENTLKHDVKDVIKLIVADYLKNSDVVEKAIQKYFNSDSFKQITLKQLEYRKRDIEREMQNEIDED